MCLRTAVSVSVRVQVLDVLKQKLLFRYVLTPKACNLSSAKRTFKSSHNLGMLPLLAKSNYLWTGVGYSWLSEWVGEL